jgi:hypothetical protein
MKIFIVINFHPNLKHLLVQLYYRAFIRDLIFRKGLASSVSILGLASFRLGP